MQRVFYGVTVFSVILEVLAIYQRLGYPSMLRHLVLFGFRLLLIYENGLSRVKLTLVCVA